MLDELFEKRTQAIFHLIGILQSLSHQVYRLNVSQFQDIWYDFPLSTPLSQNVNLLDNLRYNQMQTLRLKET